MSSNALSAVDIKSLHNQAISAGASSTVLQAIKAAADKSGVDFTYLLKKACQESSFDPTAQASTSSAKGLYQFTSQTWLSMVKSEGAKYGLGDYADHITVDSSGVAHVDSKAWKHAILNLRNDPAISAEMAAELDKKNLATLQDNVGGKLGGTEVYLAHFLGASGACDLLNTMKEDPNATAAEVLPSAAAANSSVFYKADGTARTVAEVYKNFAHKFGSTHSVLASADTSSKATPAVVTTGTATIAQNAYTLPNVIANAGDVLGHSFAHTATYNVAANTGSGSTITTISAANKASSAATAGTATASSLYATMVLAQMHNDGMNSIAALSGTTNAANNKKQSAYAANDHLG